MKTWETVLSVTMTVALAAVAGAIGAQWALRSRPAPEPQLVVLDMARLIQPIAKDPALSDDEKRERTQALGRSVGERIEALAAQGVVVLDASAIVRAPDARFVEP